MLKDLRLINEYEIAAICMLAQQPYHSYGISNDDADENKPVVEIQTTRIDKGDRYDGTIELYKNGDIKLVRVSNHSLTYDNIPFDNTDIFKFLANAGYFNPRALLFEGQFSGLISQTGEQAMIGDTIQFATTEGNILTHKLWYSDEFHCVMVGNMPYFKLYESAYIQPSKLVFDIVKS